MNTAEQHDEVGEENTENVLRATPDLVEVRRNGGLAALVGVVASAVAIAYLSRAASTGAAVDWVLFAVMGLLGAGHLRAFVDARTPLVVADEQGLRVRLAGAWSGLPWGALESIEHTPRRGLLRDGRLVIRPHNTDRVLAELHAPGLRQTRLNRRLYGAPFAVPLGLSTRVGKGPEDLTTSLRQLAGERTRVVEPLPETPQTEDADEEVAAQERPHQQLTPSGPSPDAPSPDAPSPDAPGSAASGPDAFDPDAFGPDVSGSGSTGPGETSLVDRGQPDDGDDEEDGRVAGRDPRPVLASAIAFLSGRRGRNDAEDPDEAAGLDSSPEPAGDAEADPVVASATPAPLREARAAARADVRSDGSAHAEPEHAAEDRPQGRELRRPGSVDLVEETTVWGDRVRPIATAKTNVEPLVIDEYEAEPAADPVIGPDITAARTRIGLSVDQLAERTRIRPHVIESIEVDDFAPCGGDFYARGHLRTLARVLGLDDAALLRTYDDRYADAPVNPRRVFEAELATGSSGGIRSTRGGPNWSVLIAVVMTLVLAWSVARLVMDEPPELQNPAPMLNGSGGPNQAGTAGNVTLKVTSSGDSHLTVTNARGRAIFDEQVEYGEVHRLDVAPPVKVKASDAGAIDVVIDGDSRGTLGAEGEEAQKTFGGSGG